MNAAVTPFAHRDPEAILDRHAYPEDHRRPHGFIARRDRSGLAGERGVAGQPPGGEASSSRSGTGSHVSNGSAPSPNKSICRLRQSSAWPDERNAIRIEFLACMANQDAAQIANGSGAPSRRDVDDDLLREMAILRGQPMAHQRRLRLRLSDLGETDRTDDRSPCTISQVAERLVRCWLDRRFFISRTCSREMGHASAGPADRGRGACRSLGRIPHHRPESRAKATPEGRGAFGSGDRRGDGRAALCPKPGQSGSAAAAVAANGADAGLLESAVAAVRATAAPPTNRAGRRPRTQCRRTIPLQFLESLPETAGRFELNAALDFKFGPRPAEVDLLCRSPRIAIELDGYFHFLAPDGYRRDRTKDWEFQRRGFVVLRFLAEDVIPQLEMIRDRILDALTITPPGAHP